MFRTKSIEDSIVFEENQGDTILLTYEPGNCTRYVLLLQKLVLSIRGETHINCQENSWMVTLLTLPSKRPSVVLAPEGFLHWSYLEEKLDVCTGDAVVLAEIIGEKIGRGYETSASARMSMTQPTL